LFWLMCCCVVFFLIAWGLGRSFLSHSFSYLPWEDCISGHCKLVFLLWLGHGGASTARLKFCLTILRSSSTPYPCAILALLVVRMLVYVSFFIHFRSHRTLDQLFKKPKSPPGIGRLLNPLFHRDSPLHPPALLNASSCVNRKLIVLAFFALLFLPLAIIGPFHSRYPRWCLTWLYLATASQLPFYFSPKLPFSFPQLFAS